MNSSSLRYFYEVTYFSKRGMFRFLQTSCALAVGLFIFFFSISSKAEPPGEASNWTKTFEDNFNGSRLDTAKWYPSLWWGNGIINDGSISYYSPNNVSVSGGYLSLKVNKNSEGGMSYTGGIIDSYNKFYQTYGYFEARTKVSNALGVGSYFLLMSLDAQWPPEMDIFELPGLRGKSATTVFMTNHYLDTLGNAASLGGNWTSSVGLDKGYHVYGLLWESGLLVWYVDGAERYRTTVGVPSKPCYIRFGYGVGNDNNWVGSPGTTFPHYMFVDWVRVWKKAS